LLDVDLVASLVEHPALGECLRAGVLCNDSQLMRDANERLNVQGDPTEAALLVAAEKGGLLHADTHRESPRVDMIPFESGHMFRATLHDTRVARVIYKVGAVERLLDRCTDALDDSGKLVPLDPQTVHRAVEQMAARGLRVLAFVRRQVAANHARLEHSVAAGLTFLGLQGMIDPPRPEAIEAVRQCQQAGIAVKMMLAGAFGLFHWEHGAEGRNLGEARTVVVNVIVMVQAFYLLNSRSLSRSMFSVGVFSNRWVWLGLAGMAVAQLLFTYAPFMNRLFHTTPVRGEAWLYIVATGVAAYTVVEFEKWMRFGIGGAKKARPSSDTAKHHD
jgi:magnesium-transporting ATPase (P-type)